MAKSNPKDKYTLAGTKYENSSVYQANALIESCKKMSRMEGRLFYLGAMALRPQLKRGEPLPKNERGHREFKEIIIPTEDVIKLFGGNKSYYNRLKPTAKKLQSQLVDVKDGDTAEEGWISLNMFRRMEFDPKKGGLVVKFSEDMLPYLLDLQDKSYTKIAGETLFSLGSTYATRLMELMLEYQHIDVFKKTGIISRYISVEELRNWLDLKKKYTGKYGVKNLTLRAVKEPVEEINSSTKYNMQYTLRKAGNKIIGYDFTLKVPMSEEVGEDAVSVKDILSAQEQVKQSRLEQIDDALISQLIEYGVGPIVAKRLANEFPEERIQKNIEYSLQQKRVKNLGAYIAKAVKDDYASTRIVSHENTSSMGSLFEDSAVKDKEYGKRLNEFFESYGINPDMKVGSSLVAADNNHTRMSITVRNALADAGFSPELVMTAVRKRETPEKPTTEAKTFAETIEKVAASKRDIYEREVLKNEPSVLKEWERKLGAATYRAVVNAINSNNTESPMLMRMLENKGFSSQLEIELMLNEIVGELGVGEPEETGDIIIDFTPVEEGINSKPAQESPTTEESQTTLSMSEKMSKLKELAELKNMGVLTEEEFTNMKRQIINS